MSDIEINNRVEFNGVPYTVVGINETGAGTFYWLQHRAGGYHETVEPAEADRIVVTSRA